MTAKKLFQLHVSNANTQLTEDESEISNICQFNCYDWCYFSDINQAFTWNGLMLGRVLGRTRGE